jgi:hypothetical protein
LAEPMAFFNLKFNFIFLSLFPGSNSLDVNLVGVADFCRRTNKQKQMDFTMCTITMAVAPQIFSSITSSATVVVSLILQQQNFLLGSQSQKTH